MLNSQRVHELDGLRGWAALAVVMFHLFWETFGVAFPALRNPVTGFFLDGSLSIYLFFVISGEAISAFYFRNPSAYDGTAFIHALIKRYIRLTVPIFAATIILYVIGRCGLFYNIPAGAIVERQDWLGIWSNEIGFFDIFTFSFCQVYKGIDSHFAAMPFLWTMQIEIAGSFLVYFFLLLFRTVPPRPAWGFLALAAVFLCSSFWVRYLPCFFFGVIFAALRQHGFFIRISRRPPVRVLTWGMILALAVFDGFMSWGEPFVYQGIRQESVAIALCFLIYCNADCRTFLSGGLSQWLGCLSFPIYLIQFPVLVSLTSGLIVMVAHYQMLNLGNALMIGALSLAVCVVAAHLFWPVESLTKKLEYAAISRMSRKIL